MKKVFVGGSKNLKRLPPEAISRFSSLIAEGASFLVGDCMGADAHIQAFLREKGVENVCVYTAEDSPRNYLGMWEVKRVKHRRAQIWPFLHQKDKDLAMAKDADCAFMIWDGRSKGTFANLLEMLYLKKPVSIFLMETSTLLTPSSYDDLEPYVTPADAPSADALCGDPALRREILREFMPSVLMREHLQSVSLSKAQVRDLICFSPVSVEKKRKWLKLLAKRENLLYEMLRSFRENDDPQKDAATLLLEVCNSSFAERAWEIGQAIDALQLQAGEVFYLREMYYDTAHDCVRENTENGRVCIHPDAVLEHIDFALYVEKKETPPNGDILLWFVLEKWAPKGKKSMQKVYKYYFIGRELCFVEISDVGRLISDDALFVSGGHFLKSSAFGWKFHLPVPFEAGDLLLIDQRPAKPPTKTIVLRTDGEDENAVQVGYRNSQGKWVTEPLCSFFFPNGYRYVEPGEPLRNRLYLFPLYYLEKIDPALSGDDGEVADLLQMRDSLGADEEKGRA